MKHVKKIASLLLALVMVCSMAVTVFAQEVASGAGGTCSITINNASKGETYTVYKIFDATYDAEHNSIAYTYSGTLAENAYFKQDAKTGAITATDAAKDSQGNLNEDATKWVVENLKGTEITHVEADGSKVTFTGLKYGYYLVTSTYGALVAVNSTTPNAVMNDKNSKTPGWDPKGGKTIVSTNEGDSETISDTAEANIGDVINFRLSIITQNFTDENDNPIAYYTIGDTFPDGQDFISITDVKVGGTAITDYTATEGKFPITIKWVDDQGKSLYDAGANLVVNYTAKLNDKAVIDGAGNVNTATFTYGYYNPQEPEKPTPSGETETDTATIYTYALGFKKVNDKGEALAGAEFELPFYVKKDADTDGAYIYAGLEEGTDLVKKLTTPTDGLIVIKGVEAGNYTFTETKAPDGYNKLEGAFTVPAAKTGSSTTTTTITKYLDANGDITDTETTTTVTYETGKVAITDLGVVVNKTGSLLPSTGGIGTTIFYVAGSILVVVAAVLLIVKKRRRA